MSKPADQKPPQTPPYPPGTRYGLIQRDLLPAPLPQKPPQEPPYPSGTRYGLIRRDRLG
ncbi:MAG: hypothetical protein RBU45_07235 [Myxococcota bacterium]|jgi:hypothetical protein|nr:hypothetical protein [Myxococcota bacterium]